MFGLDALTIIGTALAIASQIVLLIVLSQDGFKPVVLLLCLWPLSAIYFLAQSPWRMRYPWALLTIGAILDFTSFVQHGGLSGS